MPPAARPNKTAIQERIDALLVAHQWAPTPEKKEFIQQRLDALATALEYAQ